MPALVAKREYLSLKEVTNQYPEQLIISEVSVTSQEWSSFNYDKQRGAEPLRYAMNQKADVNKNYVKLLYKIAYEHNGEEYAIIKLHIYSESKNEPTGFALSMKKSQNRWTIYDEASITDLSFLCIFLKTETLDAIFSEKKTQNQRLNTLIETSKIGGVPNLNKLMSSIKLALEKEKSSLESILDPYRLFK